MSTKAKILAELQKNLGVTHSGESLAKELNVSRTAIWKAIRSLKEEGYVITSTMNKGYALTGIADPLDAVVIQKSHPKWSIETMKTTTSTQENAKHYANQAHTTPALFISEEQTTGRGRLGRNFVSPYKSGLYMSMCLFPDSEVSNLSLLTCATAVAVAETLEFYTNDPIDIKWVNDLFYHHKKVCGILTEAITDVQTRQVHALIIGIGINLTPAGALETSELEAVAGTLFHSTDEAIQRHFSRNEFVSLFLSKWEEYYHSIEKKTFLEAYKQRSLVLAKEVRVIQGAVEYIAKALDITDEGHLLVQRLEDGQVQELSYGEVSIRPHGQTF